MYGIGVNGMPQNYALNDTLFYDTPYHPTREGAILRTERLIKDLLPNVSEDSETLVGHRQSTGKNCNYMIRNVI